MFGHKQELQGRSRPKAPQAKATFDEAVETPHSVLRRSLEVNRRERAPNRNEASAPNSSHHDLATMNGVCVATAAAYEPSWVGVQ